MDGMTEDEVTTLIKERQNKLEAFLASGGFHTLLWDEDTDTYEVAEDTQILEWIVVMRHHDLEDDRDSYSIMSAPGMSPHGKLGLLHMALEQI